MEYSYLARVSYTYELLQSIFLLHTAGSIQYEGGSFVHLANLQCLQILGSDSRVYLQEKNGGGVECDDVPMYDTTLHYLIRCYAVTFTMGKRIAQ